MHATDDPSWGHYTQTVIELFERRDLRIDLRLPVPPEARTALAARGLDGPFAVLTAANPRGQTVSAEDNRRRERWLLETVDRLCHRHVPADGVSPDGQHRERGVAACLTRAAATALAKEFGQSAFFWFDGTDFWLIGALVDAEPLRLPAAARTIS